MCTRICDFSIHLGMRAFFLVVPPHVLFWNQSYSATISQTRFSWNGREIIQFFRHLLIKQVKKFKSKYFFTKTVFKTWTNCTKKPRWILHLDERIVFLNWIFQKATFLLFHLLQILCKLICSCESCTLPIFINFWKKCLDASMHLYMRLGSSINQSVSPSLSFHPSVLLMVWLSMNLAFRAAAPIGDKVL